MKGGKSKWGQKYFLKWGLHGRPLQVPVKTIGYKGSSGKADLIWGGIETNYSSGLLSRLAFVEKQT